MSLSFFNNSFVSKINFTFIDVNLSVCHTIWFKSSFIEIISWMLKRNKDEHKKLFCICQKKFVDSFSTQFILNKFACCRINLYWWNLHWILLSLLYGRYCSSFGSRKFHFYYRFEWKNTLQAFSRFSNEITQFTSISVSLATKHCAQCTYNCTKLTSNRISSSTNAE